MGSSRLTLHSLFEISGRYPRTTPSPDPASPSPRLNLREVTPDRLDTRGWTDPTSRTSAVDPVPQVP